MNGSHIQSRPHPDDEFDASPQFEDLEPGQIQEQELRQHLGLAPTHHREASDPKILHPQFFATQYMPNNAYDHRNFGIAPPPYGIPGVQNGPMMSYGMSPQTNPNAYVPPHRQQNLQGQPVSQPKPVEFSVFVGSLGPDIKAENLSTPFQNKYSSFIKAQVMHHRESGKSRGFGFIRFSDRAERDDALVNMNGIFIGNKQITVSTASKEDPSVQPMNTMQVAQGQSLMPMQMPMQMQMQMSRGGVQWPQMQNTIQYVQQQYIPAEMYNPNLRQFLQPNPAPVYQNSPAPVYQTSAAPVYQINPAQIYQQPMPPNTHGFQVPASEVGNTTVFVGGLASGIGEPQLRGVFGRLGEIQHVAIPAGKGCAFIRYIDHSSAVRAIIALQGHPIGNARVRLSWGRHANKDPNRAPN